MIESKKRESRLVNKSALDFPDEILEAGSSKEFDIIMEWTREEMVESIQNWEQKCFSVEQRRDELQHALLIGIGLIDGKISEEESWIKSTRKLL